MTDADTLRAVAELAKGGKGSPELAPLLERSGCFYLLSRLGKTGKLQRETVFNALCAKERYRACAPVLEKLEEASIPYAVIKGAVLSQAAYGSVSFRHSSDLDLLVSRSRADALKSILLENGFVQGRVTDAGILPYSRREIIFQAGLSHQTAPFVKHTGNPLCPYVNVDVNLDLFWGESRRKADMDFVLSETEEAEVCGVRIRKLPPEMEFVSLCLHHYKDMNSLYLLMRDGLRLDEFCDLYFYLKRVRPDIPGLLSAAERLGAGAYLYYCLFYTGRIFEDPLLEPYLDAFRSPEGEAVLERYGLAEDEYAWWEMPFPERLLSGRLPEYLGSLLGEEKRQKVLLNREMME